jgi:hypothetical protein
MSFDAMVPWTQTVHYLASRIALSPNGPSFHLNLVSLEYHRGRQDDFLADGTLAQTMHIHRTDTNTISKHKEMRFHMTYVTNELHQVHPK